MKTTEIQQVCVVGAGFMGAQIGLQCAAHGYSVWMADTSPEALDRAREDQSRELDQRVGAGQITAGEREDIRSRVRFTTDLREGNLSADLAIEAVPERLEVKRAVFARLDQLCPSHAILATNSSSIRISLIEDATRRPDRVLNMHFYARVWERPMVELMRGTVTSEDTIGRAYRFAESIGVVPLVVRRESTGFIHNRIWRAIKKECLRVIADGVATHEDVDRAWMIANGAPMGPCAYMDLIGLDVVRDIEQVYYRESGDPSDAPPRFLLEMIARGELGVKTGAGFYTYPDPPFEDPAWIRGGDR